MSPWASARGLRRRPEQGRRILRSAQNDKWSVRMNFVKMQATGNDFILIEARRMKRDWSALAKAMCHRRFGVGADGVLFISASKKANFYMRMFNPDGSEAEACGNGLRCAAKYAVESGLVDKPEGRRAKPA